MSGRRRIFFRRRGGSKLPLLLAVLVVLAAWTPKSEIWTPEETVAPGSADQVRFHHVVAFGDTEARISENELKNLAIFIKRLGTGSGIQFDVSSRSSEPGTALAALREEEIVHQLWRLGLQPEAITIRGTGISRPGDGGASVEVTVARHLRQWRATSGISPRIPIAVAQAEFVTGGAAQ